MMLILDYSFDKELIYVDNLWLPDTLIYLKTMITSYSFDKRYMWYVDNLIISDYDF